MQAWQFTDAAQGLEKSILLKHSVEPPNSSGSSSLIAVTAAAINPLDYKVAEFSFLSRFMYGFPASPGIDFCGHIIETGSTDFHKGQRVFGRLDRPTRYGTLAQLTVAGEEIAAVPDDVSDEEAAAVGTAGLTAYQCLKIGQVAMGSKVFINGGSGGTGTWSIQFAKALGCEITTSCSTRNIELCKALGAIDIIDYSREDLLAALKKKRNYFDLVIDNVGQPWDLFQQADHFLKDGGRYVQIGAVITFSGIRNLLGRKLLPKALGNGSRQWVYHHAESSRTDLEKIGNWLSEKKVKAVIDSRFEWELAPEAYRRLKSGKAQGKVVIHVTATRPEIHQNFQ